MAGDKTPGLKSQKSTSTLTLADQLPATPQLPFEPPRRHSSLAFSKITEPLVIDERYQTGSTRVPVVKDQTPNLRSNIGRKRALETPVASSSITQSHVTSIQKVFQTARANLHLDMHFAAPPAGSIGSRLSLPNQDQENRLRDVQVKKPDRSWRYSNLPRLFSEASSDVREPLPGDSPALPRVILRSSGSDFVDVEPTSSGFASPLSASRETKKDSEIDLPPLPASSPLDSDMANHEEFDLAPSSSTGTEGISGLTKPMTGLKVVSHSEVQGEQGSDLPDDSPTISHLRRRPRTDHELATNIPGCPDSIFLSQSARAAAESARAKRGLPSRSSDDSDIKERLAYISQCPDPSAHRQNRSSCPDPEIHRYVATRPCPEPQAHVQMKTPEVFVAARDDVPVTTQTWANDHFITGGNDMSINTPIMMGYRTTAAGSPMPFRHPARKIESHQLQGSILNLPPPLPHPHLQPAPLMQRKSNHSQKPSEHFRPGWHYARKGAEIHSRPGSNLYSFSTAAAKVTGESAAPDSRIRDSYRTDTLTPLARPPGRFRKTGIAAQLQASRPRRYHRGLPRRFSYGRLPPDPNRRSDMSHLRSIQSKSSPVRPSAYYIPDAKPSRRDHHDSNASGFDIAEDETVASIRSSMRLRPSEEVIQIDEHTRAAVRMSLFGRKTPDCLHGEKEGIRELSPNVNIWRKGMSGGPCYRKKRRPSYWDDDLEEIMRSPAARRGIASSPPMSKRSVVAELDGVSSQADAIPVDENVRLDQEGYIGDRLRNEIPEVNMTDVTELEA